MSCAWNPLSNQRYNVDPTQARAAKANTKKKSYGSLTSIQGIKIRNKKKEDWTNSMCIDCF
ncbi:MAG: hypothetical protein MR591_07360 [Helicobacter sp.]|uniref:hypothetical protein n=1 Tax=Helicobacter sp. TaxID=218 RepID=UPI002A78285D|nr:hypothetical protein [Helicobacter sp.]MDY2822928.1 hypothetical protein [Helicobacter sp.]